MTIKKITKGDSYHIDWLLQHENHGLDTAGLSEVCKILIEKVNQLIDVTTNSLEQTEAGGQFLKTSQTKDNQQSDEQLLLKHDVTNSEAAVVRCPECLQPCKQEELDMFGGLCEECTTDW